MLLTPGAASTLESVRQMEVFQGRLYLADVGLQQLYIVPDTKKGIVDWQEQVTNEQYEKK